MGDGSGIAISWSDLPKDLLEKISKRLDTETDARRFRAVCSSWRSSTPPVKKSPLTSLKLPFPFFARGHNRDGAYMSLTERTVYRLQPPNCRGPNFWLVKIETSKDGKSRLLNPVSDHEIKLFPETQMPKVLNTLDFRVSEVCKSYTLRCEKYGYKVARKVVVSRGANSDEYFITALDYSGDLWYIKSGHKKWTNVHFTSYLDIVNYKGQLYGVEASGNVCLFVSMFEGKKITYNSEDRGACGASNRHLVELFDGELVLVDLVTDKQEGECTCLDDNDDDDDFDVECHCIISRTPVTSAAEKIIISRMDKSKGEWVKANTEFDGIIFVGDDCCFSFSAQELEKGCKGIRAFYSDPYVCFRTDGKKKPHFDNDCDFGVEDFECYCCDPPEDIVMVDNFIPSDDVKVKFRGLHGHNTGMCDFETGKLGSLLKFPEYAELFWPPPSWLNRG